MLLNCMLFVYRSDHLPQPGSQADIQTPVKRVAAASTPSKHSDLCRRCGLKVYPVERIDVGEMFHRGCFKCQVNLYKETDT